MDTLSITAFFFVHMPHAPRSSASAARNHLLRALPVEEFGPLFPKLDPIVFCPGEVLYEPGQSLTHLYFPTTCAVSLAYVAGDGWAVGIGLAGKAGVVGVELILHGDTTHSRAVVQVPGQAFRMSNSSIYKTGSQRLRTPRSRQAGALALPPIPCQLCSPLVRAWAVVKRESSKRRRKQPAKSGGTGKSASSNKSGHEASPQSAQCPGNPPSYFPLWPARAVQIRLPLRTPHDQNTG